eukprot:2389261-Prymnesium_polylepis.1
MPARGSHTSEDDQVAGVEDELNLLTAHVERAHTERRVVLRRVQHDQRHVSPRRQCWHCLVLVDAARIALVTAPLRPHTFVVKGVRRSRVAVEELLVAPPLALAVGAAEARLLPRAHKLHRIAAVGNSTERVRVLWLLERFASVVAGRPAPAAPVEELI